MPLSVFWPFCLICFVQQGMYLRDVLDDLSRRKLRDLVDFEWKRNIRFYGTDNSRAPGKLTEETGFSFSRRRCMAAKIIISSSDVLAHSCWRLSRSQAAKIAGRRLKRKTQRRVFNRGGGLCQLKYHWTIRSWGHDRPLTMQMCDSVMFVGSSKVVSDNHI